MSSSAASSLSSKRKKGTAEDAIDLDSDLSSDRGSSLDPDYSLSKRIKTCASSSSPPSRNKITPSSSSSKHPCYDISHSESSSGSESGSSDGDTSGDMDPDFAARGHHDLDLNHMLRQLDRSSRTKHMVVLAADLQAIRDQLKNFEAVAESYQESYDEQQSEYRRKLHAYNALKGRGSAPKTTLDARRAEVRILADEVEQQDREVSCMWRAQTHYKEWVTGLSDVRDTFTQLWDVYESITKPGPSSAPVQARSLWGHGYGFQLHVAMQEARAKVIKAEAEVQACLAYLRELNESETSE
ncbi:uncharacterized protein A1O9_12610 [Exophiala aquamarina CBS 119918]|uniref:Uncharacterized protein n=1 Tax=Exophiala aquamarina CBS 119918 TaxID=1182545 RepID=A0A072P6Q7_9EURO|nr:uncharacterized protein A1O9_12610 [Exophiala aquamarina CBS 119918]KEF51260.1 hypothetical protein A1O9_12610 [Exophiala aquamarina CBS 119918]